MNLISLVLICVLLILMPVKKHGFHIVSLIIYTFPFLQYLTFTPRFCNQPTKRWRFSLQRGTRLCGLSHWHCASGAVFSKCVIIIASENIILSFSKNLSQKETASTSRMRDLGSSFREYGPSVLYRVSREIYCSLYRRIEKKKQGRKCSITFLGPICILGLTGLWSFT